MSTSTEVQIPNTNRGLQVSIRKELKRRGYKPGFSRDLQAFLAGVLGKASEHFEAKGEGVPKFVDSSAIPAWTDFYLKWVGPTRK